MGNRVVARCEGCKQEIVLAQEEAESSAHLSVPEFEAFLRDHQACRSKVTAGPHITRHTESGD